MELIEFISSVPEGKLNHLEDKIKNRILENKIVRCRDCKYADDKTAWWLGSGYTHCKYVNWWNNSDDYCSYGERRTDESDK